MEKHTKWLPNELAVLDRLVIEFPKKGYKYYAEVINQECNSIVTADSVRKQLAKTGRNKRNVTPQQDIANITEEASEEESSIVQVNEADVIKLESQIPNELPEDGSTIVSLRQNVEEQDVEEFFNAVQHYQKVLQKTDERKTHVRLRVVHDKPIGITFPGDLHIGGLHTDHEGMERDFDAISNTEGVYSILMGDYADNYISGVHLGSQWDQIITPERQQDVIAHLFAKYFKKKTLGVIKGNHDNWEYKSTSVDFVKYLARLVEAEYMWYGGQLVLEFGSQVYKIQAHHSYKYNSSLNTTNSQRNLFASTHADIVALAHIHSNELHEKTAGKKDTVWIRGGSYKITDDYGQWIGGYCADPRIPMVVVFPDKNKKVGFRDYRDGMLYLKAAREQYS